MRNPIRYAIYWEITGYPSRATFSGCTVVNPADLESEVERLQTAGFATEIVPEYV